MFETRDAGEQRDIGRPQAFRIRQPIADGDRHAPHRIGRGRRDQITPQGVLVAAAAIEQARFVAPKRRHEKARLVQQLRGAPVRLGRRLELAAQQPVEIIHGAVQPADLIVEADHLGDEGRTHVKRRRDPRFFRVASGGAQQRLALERREHSRRMLEPRRQQIVKVAARAEVRQHAIGARHAVRGERAPQLLGGGAGRYDDERVGGGRRVEAGGELNEVRAKTRQVRRAKQARAAGRDHWRVGGSMAAVRSARARV